MRKTKAVECNGKTYVARELTPREIDRLFDQSAAGGEAIADAMLDVHDLNLVLLAEMLGMEPSAAAELVLDTTPSAYAPILAAVREVNPDFFAMARQRKNLAGQLERLERMLDSNSGPLSASSSNTDTATPGITA